MDAERQIVANQRLVNGPVLAPPQRLGGPGDEERLNEAPVAGDAVDLGRRQRGVLVRHDDRGAQARLRIDPFFHLPVVCRRRQRRGVGEVEHATSPVERVEHAVVHLPLVEELRLEEREVRAGRQAGRRPGVGSRGVEIRARVVGAGVAAHPEGLVVAAPALREILTQGLRRRDRVVNVAVDHRELRLAARRRLRRRQGHRVPPCGSR